VACARPDRYETVVVETERGAHVSTVRKGYVHRIRKLTSCIGGDDPPTALRVGSDHTATVSPRVVTPH
jgi:hypothetical protein